jgi:hypothetical protein
VAVSARSPLWPERTAEDASVGMARPGAVIRPSNCTGRVGARLDVSGLRGEMSAVAPCCQPREDPDWSHQRGGEGDHVRTAVIRPSLYSRLVGGHFRESGLATFLRGGWPRGESGRQRTKSPLWPERTGWNASVGWRGARLSFDRRSTTSRRRRGSSGEEASRRRCWRTRTPTVIRPSPYSRCGCALR